MKNCVMIEAVVFLLYHIIIYLNVFYWDYHHLVMWRENFPVLSSHPYLDPKSLMSFENSSEILMNIATSLSEAFLQVLGMH